MPKKQSGRNPRRRKKGSLIFVAGGSGAGKTTLAKALTNYQWESLGLPEDFTLGEVSPVKTRKLDTDSEQNLEVVTVEEFEKILKRRQFAHTYTLYNEHDPNKPNYGVLKKDLDQAAKSNDISFLVSQFRFVRDEEVAKSVVKYFPSSQHILLLNPDIRETINIIKSRSYSTESSSTDQPKAQEMRIAAASLRLALDRYDHEEGKYDAIFTSRRHIFPVFEGMKNSAAEIRAMAEKVVSYIYARQRFGHSIISSELHERYVTECIEKIFKEPADTIVESTAPGRTPRFEITFSEEEIREAVKSFHDRFGKDDNYLRRQYSESFEEKLADTDPSTVADGIMNKYIQPRVVMAASKGFGRVNVVLDENPTISVPELGDNNHRRDYGLLAKHITQSLIRGRAPTIYKEWTENSPTHDFPLGLVSIDDQFTMTPALSYGATDLPWLQGVYVPVNPEEALHPQDDSEIKMTTFAQYPSINDSIYLLNILFLKGPAQRVLETEPMSKEVQYQILAQPDSHRSP